MAGCCESSGSCPGPSWTKFSTPMVLGIGQGGPVLKSLACSGQTSCAPGRTRDAGLTWLLGVDRLEVVHRLLRHSLWSTWPT